MKRSITFIVLLIIIIVTLCIVVYLVPHTTDQQHQSESVCGLTVSGVNIWDLDEYNAFVRLESRLPAGFIRADMLEPFGSFSGFVCDDSEFTNYAYRLLLENGNPITLRINHNSQDHRIQPSTISTSNIGSDMKKLTSNQTGSIYQNGIEYRYTKGCLYYICWSVGDIEYAINVSSAWSKYPTLSEDSLISRLLSSSVDIQSSAVNELSAIGSGSSNLSK